MTRMGRPIEDWRQCERSLQKTYGKRLWGPFTAAIGRYGLLAQGDVVCVTLDGSANAWALAKLMQVYSRFSRTSFRATFALAEESEALRAAAERLRIPIDGEGAACTKRAAADCFEDVLETTLSGMFAEGVLRGLPPAARVDGQSVIRPLCLIRARDIDAWARASGVAVPARRRFPARDRLFDALGREDANIEMNIFNCIFAVRPETLPTMFNGEGS